MKIFLKFTLIITFILIFFLIVIFSLAIYKSHSTGISFNFINSFIEEYYNDKEKTALISNCLLRFNHELGFYIEIEGIENTQNSQVVKVNNILLDFNLLKLLRNPQSSEIKINISDLKIINDVKQLHLSNVIGTLINKDFNFSADIFNYEPEGNTVLKNVNGLIKNSRNFSIYSDNITIEHNDYLIIPESINIETINSNVEIHIKRLVSSGISDDTWAESVFVKYDLDSFRSKDNELEIILLLKISNDKKYNLIFKRSSTKYQNIFMHMSPIDMPEGVDYFFRDCHKCWWLIIPPL